MAGGTVRGLACALAVLLATSAACAARGKLADCGDEMSTSRTLSGGAIARVWSAVDVPGLELLVVPGDPWGHGAVCEVGSGALSDGEDAFRLARGRLDAPDPLTLATLSMLLLERGLAGKVPWSGPGSHGVRAPMDGVGAGVPVAEGGVLTYWRPHQQAASFVRVTLDLESLTLTETLETAVASQQSGGDAITRAEQNLQSDQVPTRQAAIRTLAEATDPRADVLLLDAVLNNVSWIVRQDAARVLGQRAPEGAVAVLGRVLLGDGHARVRTQAASALCEIGDSASADALNRAAEGDADAGVRGAAKGCLSRLP
ncbi:MAG: hypothetical protein ACI8RZ_002954 [Myxococcota bacterium]|jgi:hypothetical protein